MLRPHGYYTARSSRRRVCPVPALSFLAITLFGGIVRSQNATTTIACGQAGYYNCAVEDGGGCCPIGLFCGATDCVEISSVLATVTSTQIELGTGTYFPESTSPPPSASASECIGHKGYIACQHPLHSGGDCCPFGYHCDGLVQCRLTLKLNEETGTITTTHGDGAIEVLVTTSVVGPSVTAADRILQEAATTSNSSTKATSAPPTSPHSQLEVTSGSTGVVVQTGSESGPGPGLTSPQVGGIVGGVVGFVLLLAAAAAFIQFRLRQRAQAHLRADERPIGTGDHSEDQELDAYLSEKTELDVDSSRAELGS
ncbi:hypothetical protein B0H67DRAFT_561119, partial [Lasiosphaeris hirsuta]